MTDCQNPTAEDLRRFRHELQDRLDSFWQETESGAHEHERVYDDQVTVANSYVGKSITAERQGNHCEALKYIATAEEYLKRARSKGEPLAGKKSEPVDDKNIRQLALELEKWALARREESYQEVANLLKRRDPKEIARALQQIPLDAVCAQVLVVLKNSNPSLHAQTLFFLDLYSDPSCTPLLRDRVSRLIHSIHVPKVSIQDEALVTFRTLSLVAHHCPDNNFRNLHTPNIDYLEGIKIVSITTTEDDRSFVIVAQPNDIKLDDF